MDIQVELSHGCHGYHKEVMLIFGVDEDLRAAFKLALGGFLISTSGLPSLGWLMIASVCHATSSAVWRKK